MSSTALPEVPRISRNAVIAGSVVLFHVAALWALQSGLIRRAVEIIVPVAILSEIITPPAPKMEPPAPPKPPEPAPQPVVKKTAPPPAPQPVAIPDPAPAPNAPTGVFGPSPALPPISEPVAAAPSPAPAAPPAPPAVEPPIIDASYSANEELFRPPAISRRLGEYGVVTLQVTVGIDGFASKVTLMKSSGFLRLDEAAVQGAKRLKFRPAMRAGVPVEYTYVLPVRYQENK